MNYLLYLPDGYEADTTRWPLMVFLHGAGETGDNVEKLKVHGPPKLIEQGKKYPFIVVSPQSPQHGWNADFVIKLIRDIKKNYRVDDERVYLTGLSMGGFGTWHTAQTFPDVFAAIVPICGGGDPNTVWSLQNIPIWCFHGDKDDVVKLSNSQKMIDALEPLNNPNVKFTVYPGVAHDSWTQTYDNDEVYEWMLSHKRFKYTQVSLDKKLLEEYAGTYVFPEYNDTLNFVVADNELQFMRGDKLQLTLKPYANNKFFWEPDKFEHIEFNRDASNNVTNFTFVGSRNKNTYLKID